MARVRLWWVGRAGAAGGTLARADRWRKHSSLALFCLLLIGCAPGTHQGGAPFHHLSDGFRNPPNSPEPNGFWTTLPFLVRFPFQRFDPAIAEGHTLPRSDVRAAVQSAAGQDSITWIGHMTALIELDGHQVLTDPWFTDHCSPLPPFGPKRAVPPALSVEELPPIDLILISHSHYDHLDLPSLQAIAERQDPVVVVPLGLAELVREQGFSLVVELDWHEQLRVGGLDVTALPVIHWSKRSLWRTNDTLWAGFALKSDSGRRVYFGGDAEYGPVYAETGHRYGPFDLAVLSIGAFLPREVMRGHHCAPADCLQIGLDVQAEILVGLHWGTVALGFDGLVEAPQRFTAAAAERGLDPGRAWIMDIGETRGF